MDEAFTNYYKLNVAMDLIVFLINIQLFDLPKDLQAERSNMILDSWEKRLETKIKELQESNLESIAELEGLDLDVAKILTSIHHIEPKGV
jgi:hypothetical protein